MIRRAFSAWILVTCLGLFACSKHEVVNQPVPADWFASNTLFSAFQETPKHLDSTSSYATNETTWTYAIHEPPLRYHYLKRPYTLEPRTLVDLPTVEYLDSEGRTLAEPVEGSKVAVSRYRLKLQPGILWQPHPAFAVDAKGQPRYLSLKPEDLDGKRTPADFEHQASRELTSDDYIYAIKRLATPRVVSPSFGFLSQHIIGLTELAESLKVADTAIKSKLTARQAGSLGEPPWLDLRAFPLQGVRAVDKYSFEIDVKGRYPQFKYWLAMTFLAPFAWEVDAFYAQQGMKARNLSADIWPVGTGPYMLTTFEPNARLILERNPNFRGIAYPCEGSEQDRAEGLLKDCGKMMPFIDRMVSLIEKESAPLNAKFLQGYYDIPLFEQGEPGTDMLVAIADQTGASKTLLRNQVKLPTTPQVSLWFYGFNWLDPVVGGGSTPEQAERNRKLRQAIAIAFDIEEYIAIFEANRATVNVGPVPAGLFGTDQVTHNPVVYDIVDGKPKRKPIEVAQRLLAEAGYPQGRDAQSGRQLIINFDTQGVGPGYKARIDWTVKQFEKLGIALEVRNTDYNRFQDKMRKGAAQFFFWGWVADYPDAENFLFLLYGPNSKVKTDGENAANYQSKAFDRLFEQMKDLDDTPRKAELIRQMIEVLQVDSPWLFGWTNQYAGAYQQWVENGKPSNIINDRLMYLRLDPEWRARKIAEWNTPRFWPLGLVAALLALLIGPAWLAFLRRERARALDLPSSAGQSTANKVSGSS